MSTAFVLAILIVIANVAKAVMDRNVHEKDQQTKALDVQVKAYQADLSRAKAADEDMKQYPPVWEATNSRIASHKSVGSTKTLELSGKPGPSSEVPVSTGSAPSLESLIPVDVTPSQATVDTEVPVPASEALELKATETVVLVVGPGARVVIGSYPEFGMRLATLVAPGINEKIKMFDSSEDEEQVIFEADLLGRSRLKAIRSEASVVEAPHVRVM